MMVVATQMKFTTAHHVKHAAYLKEVNVHGHGLKVSILLVDQVGTIALVLAKLTVQNAHNAQLEMKKV